MRSLFIALLVSIPAFSQCIPVINPFTGLMDCTSGTPTGGGFISGASAVAAGQVLFGTAAGVAGSEAAFAYDAATNTLGVDGMIRATGSSAPATGSGLELVYSGGVGTVRSFNRGTSGFTPLTVDGTDFRVLISGTERARFSASTGNLLLGTTTDDATNRLQVAGSGAFTLAGGAAFGNYLVFDSNTGADLRISASPAGVGEIGTTNGAAFAFLQNAAERARFSASTGNLLLGTTTDDGVNRLQVAGGIVNTGRVRSTGGNMEVFTGFGIQNVNSNGMGIVFPTSLINFASSAGQSLMSLADAGTLEIRNQSPSAGSTSLVVRAGAGQLGNLTTWQNNAGAEVASITPTGRFVTKASVYIDVGTGGAVLNPFLATMGSFSRGVAVGFANESDGAFMASGFLFRGTTATSTDAALARNATGLGDPAVEINNGTAGQFRDLEVRRIQFNNGSEPTCSASTRGGVIYVAGGAGVADTFRICRKDAADNYAYVALY